MIYFCEFKDRNCLSVADNIIFRGRIVWRDIATWIRIYLVSVYYGADQELQEMILEKLLSIPAEFGDMLSTFFGDGVTYEYTDYLKNYIAILVNIIHAQKAGDVNAVNEYTKQLYQNVDQRIDFLFEINPFWQKDIVQNLIYTFTGLVLQEIDSFFVKDYKKHINTFDRTLSHTSVMGDYIAEGIMQYLMYSANHPKV